MWTSPGTWRKASRWSDPRRAWGRLPRRWRVGLIAAAVTMPVAYYLTVQPWPEIASSYRRRRDERAALAPLLAEAERQPVTYPEVAVSYPAHVGRIVYWEVSVRSSDTSYVEGRPAWLVAWTNPERLQDDEVWDRERVLARIAGVKDETVFLEYLGRP